MKKKTKTDKIRNFVQFYEKAEKLKITMRHSWLSDIARQESSAEHSWMLALLAIVLFDELDTAVDQLKTLKLVIIHDLAEALTGDIPSFEISTRQDGKHAAEKIALESIVITLPKKAAKEILALWQEFEDCQTPEARFANAIDKIEVLMQHNIADISTWDQGDFTIGPYYKDHFFNFDSFMRKFKDVVDNDTIEKVINAKQESRIAKKHLEKYRKNKLVS